MAKQRTEQTSTCLQCEGDELLGVRDSARQFTEIIDELMRSYPAAGGERKPNVTAAYIVRQLIAAEKDQRRLNRQLKGEAAYRIKQSEELIAALRFVSKACNSEGAIHVLSGKAMIEVSDIIRVAIDKIQMIVAPDRSILDPDKPANDTDFMKDCWQ